MQKAYRHPEIDLLRTLAIVMMIIYHIAFDLVFIFGWDLPVTVGPWRMLANATGGLFLMLVGVSFVVSWDRTPASLRFRKFTKRAAIIFFWAMMITLVTYLFDPSIYVRFGILHLIAVSTLLQPFFRGLKLWNIPLGVVLVAIGRLTIGSVVPTSLLIPFGFVPPGFQTIDLYPLLPWFGVVLIGMALGDVFYGQKTSRPVKIESKFLTVLTWPGKHALLIYLIHQPILIAILWVLHRG